MHFAVCASTVRFSRYCFTGKERDTESGLDYFGARYYGSSMGRFMSSDDGEDQDVQDPQSWNLYSYVPTTRLRILTRMVVLLTSAMRTVRTAIRFGMIRPIPMPSNRTNSLMVHLLASYRTQDSRRTSRTLMAMLLVQLNGYLIIPALTAPPMPQSSVRSAIRGWAQSRRSSQVQLLEARLGELL